MMNSLELDINDLYLAKDLSDLCDHNSEQHKSQISLNMLSNFTKDSSSTSTCSLLYQNNVISTSQSQLDSLKSIGKGLSASFKLSQIRRKTPSLTADYRTDLPYSQASNSSTKVNVAHVLNTSIPDLASALSVAVPAIECNPDVLQTYLSNKPQRKNIDETKSGGSMQLRCDQNKLARSSVVEQISKRSNLDNVPENCALSNFTRQYVSTEVQTIPVLIFPLTDESNVSRDVSENKKKFGIKPFKDPDSKSKSNDMSQQISLDSKQKIPTSEQETQAPPIQTSRTRTHSDFTTYSKETTEKLLESSFKTLNGELNDKNTSEVVWGDVYNDYKQVQLDISDKTPTYQKDDNISKTKKLPKSPIFGIRQSRKGDITQRTGESTKDDKLLTVDSALNKQSIFIKRTKSSFGSMRFQSPSEKPSSVQYFQKFFELSPHDEMVKSYLTSSDRRIRAVCSKIGCKIGMYGPIGRYHEEGSKQVPSISRIKTFYYINVNAESKERLDKAIKCIQETFPKACLNEKTNNQLNLQNCGEEIPI